MTVVRALILCFLATALTMPAAAAERRLPGRVIHVSDGDSLILDVRGSHHRIELAGIDAPELNQPWGQAAATHLARLLTGAFVVVEIQHHEGTPGSSGKIVYKGRDVAYDLLHDGLAWSTQRGDRESTHAITAEPAPPTDPYTTAEDQARLTRRGLWVDPQPVPPWVWRRAPAGID